VAIIKSNPRIDAQRYLSATQLGLDAACSQFSAHAADAPSIGLYALSGLAGRLAGLGAASLSTAAPACLGWLARQSASIGAEAGAMTAASKILGRGERTSASREFASHCVNFAVFRWVGAAFPASHPALRHLAQSGAMLAGHRAAGLLGFEEAPASSLAGQFFDAALSVWHIQAGHALSLGLTGGRLEASSRALHLQASTAATRRAEAPLAGPLPRFFSVDTPTPPEGITEPLARIARISTLSLPENARELEDFAGEFGRQLGSFTYELDTLVSFLSTQYHNIVLQRGEVRNGYILLNAHGRLCGGSRGLLRTIDREGRTEGIPDYKGMLAGRISNFASHIVALEQRNYDRATLQGMREKVYNAYDQLLLLRESIRLYMRHAPAEETPYYQAMGHAYQGLLRGSHRQVEQVRRNTQHTLLEINEALVDRWADDFLGRCQHPRAAINAQIIRGRVSLIRGVPIGGNFYEALREDPLPYHKSVRLLFDRSTGQIVAFLDRSNRADATRQAFEARDIRLQEATLYVDPIESGTITGVRIHGENHRLTIENALNSLVGFQVMPSNRVWAFENPENTATGLWTVSFHWNVVENPEAQLHRLLQVSKPFGRGEPSVPWRILVLQPILGEPNDTLQLWVPDAALQHDNLTRLVKVTRSP